jgi:hypothetical protein
MRSRPAFRFNCTATTEGAVLVLPEGASRKDIRGHKAQFRRCAMENAFCWYQFANKRLERDIPNGSLILVTGCDMAASWGIASFSDIPSDVEVELSLYPSHHGTYMWETNVSATLRANPGYESISALNRKISGAPSAWDQADTKGIMMASTSQNVDATFNEVVGNQIHNISLATVGKGCKL